jgi:hypothetical protein
VVIVRLVKDKEEGPFGDEGVSLFSPDFISSLPPSMLGLVVSAYRVIPAYFHGPDQVGIPDSCISRRHC